MNDARDANAPWRPTANLAMLQRRAAALANAREFFRQRGVLEVETPALVNAPVSDVNITSAEVELGAGTPTRFLHTSPEYAMKRLLAAGSGDIYQICRVYRGAERGRFHNPEFTMIEWYRIGFDLGALMDEVAALVRGLLGKTAGSAPPEFVNYRDAVRLHAGLDPLEAELAELRSAAADLGFDAARSAAASRDELLDLIVGAKVGPALGHTALTFLHRYPASQAALARLDPEDPRVALRFELYFRGVELANGYDELAHPGEQRRRFAADLAIRRERGLPAHGVDEHLLAALDAGLPECAGVALGFDRVLMLACGADRIDDVMAFPLERA
jgi:lysyl-tRNA synthetase class 2